MTYFKNNLNKKNKILLFILIIIIFQLIFFGFFYIRNINLLESLNLEEDKLLREEKNLLDEKRKYEHLEKENSELNNSLKYNNDLKEDYNFNKELSNFISEVNLKDNIIKFKVDSKNFNDFIKNFNNYNFSNFQIIKNKDLIYDIDVKLISSLEKIHINKISNKEIEDKVKYNNSIERLKRINNSGNSLKESSNLKKVTLKEENPNINKKENINNKKDLKNKELKNEENPDINIAYREKIRLKPEDIRIFDENNNLEIYYDEIADIYTVKSLNINNLKDLENYILFNKVFNAKAISFELFCNENISFDIGVCCDLLYENTKEKVISDWDKYIFYDIENLQGIYFILNNNEYLNFSIRNIEVYI